MTNSTTRKPKEKKFVYRANFGLTQGQYDALKTISRIQNKPFSTVMNDMMAEIEPTLQLTARLMTEIEDAKGQIPQRVVDGLKCALDDVQGVSDAMKRHVDLFGQDVIAAISAHREAVELEDKDEK